MGGLPPISIRHIVSNWFKWIFLASEGLWIILNMDKVFLLYFVGTKATKIGTLLSNHILTLFFFPPPNSNSL